MLQREPPVAPARLNLRTVVRSRVRMPFQCREEDDILVIVSTGVIRLDDVVSLALEEERYFARPGCKGLFLCDCSDLKVFSPDGADAIIARMRDDNARVRRSAFVISEGTAALQIKRMVRDGGTENRAVFATERQARAWLLES